MFLLFLQNLQGVSLFIKVLSKQSTAYSNVPTAYFTSSGLAGDGAKVFGVFDPGEGAKEILAIIQTNYSGNLYPSIWLGEVGQTGNITYGPLSLTSDTVIEI